MGGRKRINDFITLGRDFLAGKAAGESALGTAFDIIDAPKTYEKVMGSTINQDMESIIKGVSAAPSKFELKVQEFRTTIQRGLNALKTGRIYY